MATACRRAERAAASPDTGVVVTAVSPTTVTLRAGETNELVVSGTGFDAAENTVTFGPVTLTSVKSTNGGTRISLVVPDRMPSGGGAAPMLWMAGDYPLTVSNRRGTSAPMTVTVKEPR
jgi:Quinohemoprotein amine dehydrogenase, alpha subunit domain III